MEGMGLLCGSRSGGKSRLREAEAEAGWSDFLPLGVRGIQYASGVAEQLNH